MKKISNWLKHFFIPHEGNDCQPHSLRSKTINFFIIIAIFVEVIALAGFFPLIEKQLDYFAAVVPSILVDATNTSRSEFALPELTVNDKLTNAAQLKANDMAAREYFSHNTPEGLEPWVFLQNVGYQYAAAGENLAVNFSDSYDAHDAWMNSPGHRANILQNQFTEVGIATARGKYKGRSTVFVAQFFGRPQETQFVFNPNNQLVETQFPNNQIQDVLGESIIKDQVSFIATSVEPLDSQYEPYKPATTAEKLLSSPRTFANYIFAVLGGIILLSLVLKVVFHIKKQYLRLIFNGLLLIVILTMFYIFNRELTEMVGLIG